MASRCIAKRRISKDSASAPSFRCSIGVKSRATWCLETLHDERIPVSNRSDHGRRVRRGAPSRRFVARAISVAHAFVRGDGWFSSQERAAESGARRSGGTWLERHRDRRRDRRSARAHRARSDVVGARGRRRDRAGARRRFVDGRGEADRRAGSATRAGTQRDVRCEQDHGVALAARADAHHRGHRLRSHSRIDP